MSSHQESDALEDLSPCEVRLALHNLRVHQPELGVQNEELRRAQAELAAVQARYFELYDTAPLAMRFDLALERLRRMAAAHRRDEAPHG